MVILGLGIVAFVALIYFCQHSMIYHPRPYSAAYYAVALPANGIALDYTLPFGKQTAYYLPGRNIIPTRLWVAFCGNGSLALDWTLILRDYPQNGDGFLLVDYPGYGKNSGYATIDSTRATADSAVRALSGHLHIDQQAVEYCVIGHSLGAAAALDFAVHRRVQAMVLISPFTTLREEAAEIVGGMLSRLLVENYDNRHNLEIVLHQNPGVRVAIFHGTADRNIPVRMSRELKKDFPAVDFFPVEGANHVTVLDQARDQIIDWMNR
jgi:pimeloyl-ACP methyl ester carboxylesterase